MPPEPISRINSYCEILVPGLRLTTASVLVPIVGSTVGAGGSVGALGSGVSGLSLGDGTSETTLFCCVSLPSHPVHDDGMVSTLGFPVTVGADSSLLATGTP